MQLAPWHMITRIEGYHGDLNRKEITEMLQNEADGTYIITNYDPQNKGREFSLTVRNRKLQNGSYTLMTLSLTPYRICHMISPTYSHLSHVQSQCGIPKIFNRPLKRKNPPTLKEIARAVISLEFDHGAITKLRNEGEIPRECADFLTDRSTKHIPTYTSFLFCNAYPRNI